jgi:hypothetical protein
MTPDQEKEFQKHLTNCPECKEAIKTFKSMKMTQQLQSLPLNVIQEIFNKTTRKPKFTFFDSPIRKIGIGFVAAASVLIAFAAIPSSLNKAQQINNQSYYKVSWLYYNEFEKFNSQMQYIESSLENI